jgi:poly-gamma-glutamate synthesis protein (capsule biosynthesis protein)
MSIRPERNFDSCVKYERDAEYVISTVQKIKNKSDYIILSIHWGEEYLDYPDSLQVELAHRFCNAGIDIIFGHHTHVFQGVERYGKSVIFYGLGNFITDMTQNRAKKGYVADLSLHGNNVIEYKLHYYEINGNYQPVIIDNKTEIREIDIKNLKNQNYHQDIIDSIASFRREYKIFLLTNFYRYPVIKLLIIIFQAVLRKLKIS